MKIGRHGDDRRQAEPRYEGGDGHEELRTRVADPSAEELSLLARAFESERSVFELLSTVRTRRAGLGYRFDTGEEEVLSWSSGKAATQGLGPLAYSSASDPIPLSEVEEALLCWAALGPNGLVLGDVAVNGASSSLLSWSGRTVPSSSNDLSVDLFVVNDDGVWMYRPTARRKSAREISSPDDYGKVLEWYRRDRLHLSGSRPDVGWPSAPEGTRNVSALGPGQYNLNRPGSTWLLPVGDVGLEWFNQLLVSYEWSGFFLMDPATNFPAGCKEWIKPGFLEVGFPIPAFDELALMLHAGQVGCVVQNIRLACEELGLGAWVVGSYADDLVLGAYPDVAKGLGFGFVERERTNNPAGTATCLGLPGVKDAVVVPSPRFPDAASAVRYVAELRHLRREDVASNGEGSLGAKGPYRQEVLAEILDEPRTYISDWAQEAAIATVEYIVAKYGCCPAFVNPVRAKLSVQAHHVDVDFYRTFYANGSVEGEVHGLTPAIGDHWANWHPNAVPPQFRMPAAPGHGEAAPGHGEAAPGHGEAAPGHGEAAQA